MTQPPPNEGDGDRALLFRLKQTTGADLGKGVGKVEGFTQEEEENHRRGLRSETRRAIAKIRVWALYLLFVLLSVVATFATIGLLFVLRKWVLSFWDNPAKLESFVYGVCWILLVSLATLFIERVIPDRD